MRPLNEDEDRVARDGEVMRVPIILMDSTQQAVANDAPAADPYELYDRRVSTAWRRPPAPARQPAVPSAAADAYAAYDARITSAWRGAR